MLTQPRRGGAQPSVGQHVDRSAGIHVDHDGGVPQALAQREIINTGHGDRGDRRVGLGAHQPQKAVATCRDPQCDGQTRTCPASQCQPDGLEHPPRQRCAPRVPAGQAVDLLHESPGVTTAGITEEASHPHHQNRGPPRDRRLGQHALVAAMHPGRGIPAVPAPRRGGPRAGPNLRARTESLHRINHHIPEMWK